MKNVLITLALLTLVACSGSRLSFVQAVYEPETYYKIARDTMVITKADLIAGITIDAIDTVRVKGGTTYLDSDSTVVSGYCKIYPDKSKGIGFNWDVRIGDTVTIINDGKANYWVTRVKR